LKYRKQQHGQQRKTHFFCDSDGVRNAFLSVLGMVVAFLLGLWAKEVDNAEIFSMLHPAFQTIIGGFIGLLAGVKLANDEESKECKRG
jgi:undecaprenyl pyrophosphate phosphatase UppP